MLRGSMAMERARTEASPGVQERCRRYHGRSPSSGHSTDEGLLHARPAPAAQPGGQTNAVAAIAGAFIAAVITAAGLALVALPPGPTGPPLVAGSPGTQQGGGADDVAALPGGPFLDVAALGSGGLVAISAQVGPQPGGPSVRLLERGADGWRVASSLDLDPLGNRAEGAPWLVELATSRFAVLTPLPAERATRIMVVEVGPDGLRSEAVLRFDHPVDEALGADVDGDGQDELLLDTSAVDPAGPTSQSGLLTILDGRSLAPHASHVLLNERLVAAAAVDLDEVPGAELAAYATGSCPASPVSPADLRLLVVRLLDGEVLRDTGLDAADGTIAAALPPMAVDAGGDGRPELLVRAGTGARDGGDRRSARPGRRRRPARRPARRRRTGAHPAAGWPAGPRGPDAGDASPSGVRAGRRRVAVPAARGRAVRAGRRCPAVPRPAGPSPVRGLPGGAPGAPARPRRRRLPGARDPGRQLALCDRLAGCVPGNVGADLPGDDAAGRAGGASGRCRRGSHRATPRIAGGVSGLGPRCAGWRRRARQRPRRSCRGRCGRRLPGASRSSMSRPPPSIPPIRDLRAPPLDASANDRNRGVSVAAAAGTRIVGVGFVGTEPAADTLDAFVGAFRRAPVGSEMVVAGGTASLGASRRGDVVAPGRDPVTTDYPFPAFAPDGSGRETDRGESMSVHLVGISPLGEPSGVTVVRRGIAGGAPALAVTSPALSMPWPAETLVEGSTEPGSLIAVGDGPATPTTDGRFAIPARLPPWPCDFVVRTTTPAGRTS